VRYAHNSLVFITVFTARYAHNSLVFITELESVYCAVRT
jgi:hypothetical protein